MDFTQTLDFQCHSSFQLFIAFKLAMLDGSTNGVLDFSL
jgi:hypothetical protein